MEGVFQQHIIAELSDYGQLAQLDCSNEQKCETAVDIRFI
jgi:hypothetical protein